MGRRRGGAERQFERIAEWDQRQDRQQRRHGDGDRLSPGWQLGGGRLRKRIVLERIVVFVVGRIVHPRQRDDGIGRQFVAGGIEQRLGRGGGGRRAPGAPPLRGRGGRRPPVAAP